MDEQEKRFQRMKNFLTFNIMLTDDELRTPVPKWLRVTLLVTGVIGIALLVWRLA